MTDSPTAVGVMTAFQFAPTLLLGLHAGLLADRVPKRTLLLATQVSMALTAAVLAVLTLTGRVQVWHLFTLAIVLGAVAAVDNPTRQSFVSEVVRGPQLPNAISLVSCTFQIGAMAGPVVGGVLMSTVGAGYAFALNALTFVGPVVALSLMRDTSGPAVPSRATDPAGPGTAGLGRAGLRRAHAQDPVARGHGRSVRVLHD
jgi:MFS family permease